MALSRSTGYVTYPLLTLSPLTILSITQLNSPFDLHVLATPPAFVLSQDQTLQFISSNPPSFLARARRGIIVEEGSTLWQGPQNAIYGILGILIRAESAEKTNSFFKLVAAGVSAAGAALSLLTPFRNLISNGACLA